MLKCGKQRRVATHTDAGTLGLQSRTFRRIGFLRQTLRLYNQCIASADGPTCGTVYSLMSHYQITVMVAAAHHAALLTVHDSELNV
jgi:hypothetical protein